MSVLTSKENESRLNVRLSTKVKARITQAAAILGQDLTEFTATTLNDRAVEVIERNELFELNEAEREFFFDYLDGKITAERSDRAQRAADHYLKGRKVGNTYEFAD